LVATIEACSNMARKLPLCDKADDELFPMLWQSLYRVMVANVFAKNKGFSNICDTYVENLIIEKQYGPQASYVLLFIDAHMKAAKPMYGSTVDQVQARTVRTRHPLEQCISLALEQVGADFMGEFHWKSSARLITISALCLAQ
jgi:hypothetical protein